MEDADYVKCRVNLVDLIKESGVELYGNIRLSGICPFHADNVPSLRVQPSDQHWWCFACNEGGDVFNWIMKKEDCSFKEAVLKLKTGNLGAPIIRKIEQPTRKQISPIPHILIEEWHDNLLKNQKVLDYLHKQRFWSLDVIKGYHIGFNKEARRLTIPISDPLGKHWYDVRMYSPFAKKLNIQKMLPFSKDRSSLPYDVGGMDSNTYCLLVEGEPDALAAASIGIPAATHTCGASSGERVWKVWGGLVFAPRVLICYDRDLPGQIAAQKVAPMFSNATIIELPEEVGNRGDITDLIRIKGAEWTKQYIEGFINATEELSKAI